jgi:hypothetical protein
MVSSQSQSRDTVPVKEKTHTQAKKCNPAKIHNINSEYTYLTIFNTKCTLGTDYVQFNHGILRNRNFLL